MSSPLDKFRKRLGGYGYDVGNVYKNSTEHFVNQTFSSSPTYKRATMIDNNGVISEIDIRAIGVERLGSLREILFRPNELADLGSYLFFDDAEWLVFDEYGTGISPKVMVAKCNRDIRWKDKDGILHEYMCIASASDIGSKSKQGKSEIEWNKYDIKLPRNQLFVFLPVNEYSEKIKLNNRFIFGKRVYEVVGVDDTSTVNMEGFGVIQLTIRLTTSRENDDFENGVAENLYGDSNSEVIDDEDDTGGRLW